MLTKLLDIAFAVLWSIALGFGLEYFWRRFFRKRRRSIAMAAIVGIGFLTFSLALHSRRRAAPVPLPCDASLAAPTADAPGSLDAVLEATTQAAVPDGGSIPKSRSLTLVGWAANDDGKQPARGICLSVDGVSVRALSVAYGANRLDVAQVFKTPALASTGFRIDVAPDFLPIGQHWLSIVVTNADGTRSKLKSGRTIQVR